MQKTPNFVKVNTFSAILAFNHLVTSIPYQKKLNFRQKVQIFVGGQKETTLVTLMQNSAKITKFRQSEHIFGNFSLQSPSYIHSLPKKTQFSLKSATFCRRPKRTNFGDSHAK